MTTHLTALPRIAMRRECFIRRFLVLFSAFTPLAVPGQVQVTNFVRGSNAVTFVSRGGYCPCLVRTSTNLFNWSDHGDLEVRTNWTLSAFASRSFYRVSDLNASNLYGGLFGSIQTDQGEFGSLMARHCLKARLWLSQPKGPPHTSTTYQATNYWRKLLVNLQTHWNGQVQPWIGLLEDLGRMTTSGDARTFTLAWTNATGPARRGFYAGV